MSNFQFHAQNLTTLYLARTEYQIRIRHLEEDTEARRVHVVPEEGWPGKNDEARKAARDKAFAADPTLTSIASDIRRLRDQLARVEAAIASNEVRFKADRWDTRQQLVEALRRQGTTSEEHADPL